MLGLVIGAAVALWAVFITGDTWVAAFFAATGFMWVWYWIWAFVSVGIVALLMLAITGAFTFAGAEGLGSKLGGFLGFAGGSALSFMVIIMVVINNALFLGGTYLLMTSGTAQMSTFAQFDTTKLVIGAVLLLIGVLLRRTTSTSSSNSD